MSLCVLRACWVQLCVCTALCCMYGAYTLLVYGVEVMLGSSVVSLTSAQDKSHAPASLRPCARRRRRLVSLLPYRVKYGVRYAEHALVK